MKVIIINALKERVRRKELYFVVVIGILLLLFCSSDNTSITMDGEPLTGFKNMFMIMHTLVNAFGVILAVILSMRTIPNEYERKNSHLVWVRGISQPKYHGGLAVANILASVFAAGILYVVLAVYAVIHGHAGYLPKLIPAFMMVTISISLVSLFVSVLSIKLPGMTVGGLGALFAGIGVFHGIFDLLKSVVGGPGGKCISVFLWLVPDLNGIQKQAYNLIIGKTVEWHLIWTGLLAVWVISSGLFLIKRKEA